MLILICMTIILSVNDIYAMPPIDSQRIYDNSDVILLGKVISVNSTFSPTHNLYEIKTEKFLKNSQDSNIVFTAGQKTVSPRSGDSVFSVNDRVLFFLSNDTLGYDRYDGILRILHSKLVEPQWDKCNIFEKEIPREHWFLGGAGIAPKIQQGANRDIENFKKDELVTITYDVSNLSDSAQEFDLDSTILVSNGTAFEVRAILNQHIILEPCTIYKTIDWEFTPSMTGFYNFEIKDSRSGNYGLGFTVVDNGSTVIESPLKQLKSGIEPKDVVCKIGLEPVIKKNNGKPICIKGTSMKSLTLRGYIPEYNGALGGEITSDEIVIGIPHVLPVEPKQSLISRNYWYDQKELSSIGCDKPILEHLAKHSTLLDEEFNGTYMINAIGLPNGITQEKFDECVDAIYQFRLSLHFEKLLTENQMNTPKDLVVKSATSIGGDPVCGIAVDDSDKLHWFAVDSLSNPSRMTVFQENPQPCQVNMSSCFCDAYVELVAPTTNLTYFTLQEEQKYSDILIDYLSEENINRTPKFLIGKLNINYTDSAIGYCGQIWGKNTYGFFSGGIINDTVINYGIDKELPLLCAISDDAKWQERR
ncbi:MAG: hypothetical protein EPO37_09425 [Nitrosarchaeum sp.]|nr:MAG: hypothetical protein EPO37_09425 [Nitrosarchaeum sp.]